MGTRSEMFFRHLLSYGSGQFNDFTRFSSSSFENAIDFKDVVTGVCPMFIIDQNNVMAILEARMPQRKSRKTLQDLFDSSHDKITMKIGIDLTLVHPESGFSRLSITHKIPHERTDSSFKSLIENVCSSMNELLVTVKSMEN